MVSTAKLYMLKLVCKLKIKQVVKVSTSCYESELFIIS